jgi:hypothetical protein
MLTVLNKGTTSQNNFFNNEHTHTHTQEKKFMKRDSRDTSTKYDEKLWFLIQIIWI